MEIIENIPLYGIFKGNIVFSYYKTKRKTK